MSAPVSPALAGSALTARAASLATCHDCSLLVRMPLGGHEAVFCPRCSAPVHSRKSNSLARTWALVIAAATFYIPANIFPIMSVTSLGQTQSDTIMSGVLYLLFHGMWPLALVVFAASVAVPLTKLVMIVYMLISVQRGSTGRLVDRTKLYRITEAIGRWSMVDIYVVTILVALVQLGNLATVTAQPGAIYFGAVVILTMFAAESFDPRLAWDAAELSE